MLTGIHIRNFKKLKDVEIELGQAVVLVGPNNSGKTAALQALTLWDVGRRKWVTRQERNGSLDPTRATINRTDLLAIPVPVSNLIWRDLLVSTGAKEADSGIPIQVSVTGLTNGRSWEAGFEFLYANEESFYCRVMPSSGGELFPIEETRDLRFAFLQPMSGLAAVEPRIESGRISVLIGEGQTAQVLRNLCYRVYARAKGIESESSLAVFDRPSREGAITGPSDDWDAIVAGMSALFSVRIQPPVYIAERGEIIMSYREPGGIELDLACAGRGMQQTLLLLAHLYANPHSILLLDEPDAHLEVLRQREIYRRLTTVAEQQGSQMIVASHSEVVLSEAADRDIVVAFLGPRPRRINDRSQVFKALKKIRFDDYYLAQQKGWVLYLEGSTDLAILRAFAASSGHPAQAVLAAPFLFPAFNQPARVYDHFFGLREACPELVGVAVFDRLGRKLSHKPGLTMSCWRRREIENYLAREDTLLAFARSRGPGEEFGSADAEYRADVMKACIRELAAARATLHQTDIWSPGIKASDEFLDPLFENYFQRLGLPNQMRKTSYYVLARFVPADKIDPEIIEKLDAIAEVAKQAKPAER